MRMPTHIVIDLSDGWTWSRDRDANPFTEQTATAFAAQMNDERKEDRRTFIVAAVTPLLSHEMLMAIARETNRSLGDIRAAIAEGEAAIADTSKLMVTLDEVVDARVAYNNIFTEQERETLPPMEFCKDYVTVDEANQIRAMYALEPRTWE